MNRIFLATLAGLATLATTSGPALAGSWSGGLGLGIGINVTGSAWCNKGGCQSSHCGHYGMPGGFAPAYPGVGPAAAPQANNHQAAAYPGYGYNVPQVTAYHHPSMTGYFPAITAPAYGYAPAAMAYGYGYSPYAVPQAYQNWGYQYPAFNAAPAHGYTTLTAAQK